MFKSNSKHNIWKKKTQNMQTKSANKKLFWKNVKTMNMKWINKAMKQKDL
jgi:hypothetical protein